MRLLLDFGEYKYCLGYHLALPVYEILGPCQASKLRRDFWQFPALSEVTEKLLRE